MKQIQYKIFRGEEKSNTINVTIPESIFMILVFYFPHIHQSDSNNLLSKDITKKIMFIEDKMMEMQYDIIYDIMNNTLGIESSEVVDLTKKAHQDDKIIIHVYLDID
jgi:hypothetical protein